MGFLGFGQRAWIIAWSYRVLRLDVAAAQARRLRIVPASATRRSHIRHVIVTVQAQNRHSAGTKTSRDYDHRITTRKPASGSLWASFK